MNKKEGRVMQLFAELEDNAKKGLGSHLSNRDVFYSMNIERDKNGNLHASRDKFKDQNECDNILAKLIKEHKINKKRIYEDPGIFKFNKNLEAVMKEENS